MSNESVGAPVLGIALWAFAVWFMILKEFEYALLVMAILVTMSLAFYWITRGK